RQAASALADAPCLPGLTTLRLTGWYPQGTVEPRLRSAPLANLTRLELCDSEVSVAEVEALAASTHLGRLEALALNPARLGPAQVAALARAQLPSLRRLELSGSRTDAHDVRALLRSPLLASVESLDLSCNGGRAAGWVALLEGIDFAGLKRLNLTANRL